MYRSCSRRYRRDRVRRGPRVDTPSTCRLSSDFGTSLNACADSFDDIPVCNTAVDASLDSGAEGLKPGLVLFLVLLQSSQPSAKHFARVGILAALDFGVDELVHFRGEVDVASRHGNVLFILRVERLAISWQCVPSM